MIDFVLGVYFAGLAVRGWLRGLVREAMDLLGLLIGLVVAFRLAGPLGDLLADRFGVPPEMAGLVAGTTVFVIVGAGAAVLAHYLHRVVSLPGLRLSNRVFGAGLAVAWGAVLAMVLLTLSAALPLPSSVEDRLDESRVAQALTDPDGTPQRAFQAAAGDSVFESLLSLDRLFGDRRIVLEEGATLEIEAAAAHELSPDAAAAEETFSLLNRSRLEARLDPLAWSDALAEVGARHAQEMYLEGYFSHQSPRTGDVAARTLMSGVSFRLVGENLALASTARAVHAGLMDSEAHRANILGTEYRRVGIGVVRGPLGLMVVQVFAG